MLGPYTAENRVCLAKILGDSWGIWAALPYQKVTVFGFVTDWVLGPYTAENKVCLAKILGDSWGMDVLGECPETCDAVVLVLGGEVGDVVDDAVMD